MVLQFHNEATQNFDNKASELVSLIEQLPPEGHNDEKFPSELYVSGVIHESDIIGTPEIAVTNYRGDVVARFFFHDGERYGLTQESYLQLASLAELIYKVPSVRASLSTNYVQNALFKWITQRFIEGIDSGGFVAYLETKAARDIRESSIWLPIAFLEIEHSFPISGSEFKPLTKTLIDEWENRSITDETEDPDSVRETFDKLRKEIQGLAAIVVRVNAEPERASEIALEEAERVTALLGLVSSAMHAPDIKSVARPKGSEGMAVFKSIHDAGANHLLITTTALDIPSIRSWRMDATQIETNRRMFLDPVSTLLTNEKLKEFQKKVLGSLLIYSKAAYTAEPVEKLIYMLSGLESILLRNENEPIQQNLSERMAFFIGQDVAQRKAIISSVKGVYGVRSRYLHHGHTSSELDAVSEFMKHVWVFFVQLVANVDRFATKERFLDAIDERKLA